MKTFRTYRLAVEFYRLSRSLPVRGAIKEQLSRAALSVPLNLSEGRARPTRRDQLKFFHIALGSVRECQTLLELADLTQSPAWLTLDKLGASLYRLIERAT